MNFRLENFKPKPATWLKTKIEYVGVGRAVFEEPAGVIKGSAKATFDEDGSYRIEMQAEEVEPPNLLPKQWDTIMHILTGQEPVKQEEGYAWGGSFSRKKNKCTQLTITTSEGVFSVIGKINYHHFFHKLEFFIIQSKFEVESSREEYYWVLPLTNFISNFTQSDKLLDQHSLRIYPTPAIPEGLSQEEENLAYLYANSKNSLVLFEYSKKLAFIEALYSYKESKEKLREGKEKALITAIMVGEVEQSAPRQDSSLSMPDNLLPLLGFASGSPVGSPWMEFYDKQGKLSRRMHQSLNNEPYRKGHVVLHDYVGRSKIGNLLVLAQASQHFAKDYVLISASLAIESGFFSFNITDALANLFRAFDILCKENRLHLTNLLKEVDEDYKIQIKKILKQASSEIRQISSSITDTNLISQKSNIEKIAERVQSQNQVNDAGLAIEKLLSKFGFHDANILDKYFESHPRIDNRKWHQLLSYCRGVAMHDIRIDDLYLDDLLTVKNHLYDLLVRIVFHLIDYQGTYTPIFAKNTSDEISVSWVDANLPASELGYK